MHLCLTVFTFELERIYNVYHKVRERITRTRYPLANGSEFAFAHRAFTGIDQIQKVKEALQGDSAANDLVLCQNAMLQPKRRSTPRCFGICGVIKLTISDPRRDRIEVELEEKPKGSIGDASLNLRSHFFDAHGGY